MDISREVKEKVYKLKDDIDKEISKGDTINDFQIATKIENGFEEIYDRAILHKYIDRLKNLEHMFSVKVVKNGNSIEVKIGNRIFFEDLEITIYKFNIKIVRTKVDYYAIFHEESKWRYINDDIKIKMVELYDSLLSEKISGISLETLEKSAKFNTPLESVVMEYKINFVVESIKNSSGIDNVKKFLRENYKYWKDRYSSDCNDIVKVCKVYKTLCDEKTDNIGYVDIYKLSRNMIKVESLIYKYKLYIGEVGYTSGNYRSTITKFALARGMSSEYSGGSDGVIENSSNRNVLFLGNERNGIHERFEGTLYPGWTTPLGIDVDFVYWEGYFYKVFPNIIGELFSLNNKVIMLGKMLGLNVDGLRIFDKAIVPITQITDIGVWLSNFFNDDVDKIASDGDLLQLIKNIVMLAAPLKNSIVEGGSNLLDRKSNYESKYGMKF